MRVLPKNAGKKPPFFAYLVMFLLGIILAAGYETVREYVVALNQRELLRVSSPDGKVDAVFVEPIIRTFGEDSVLNLVPKGDPAPAREPVIEGTNFKALPALVWKQPHLLAMNYGYGCINEFANLWHAHDLEDGRYYVEVLLKPTRELTCIGDGASASSSSSNPSSTKP
ncbi:MAG: hypothetical protein ACLQDV_00045 [Candidatus Binataceae bacterium]